MKIVAAVLAIALVLSIGYALHDRKQSTEQIDKSLGELQLSLKQAESEDAQYSGGLIKALIALRIETIKDTISILEKKRQSLLHRICLNYEIDGAPVKVATADELREIQKDMAETEKRIVFAKDQDAQYSGGLIKGLIAMRIATEQQTLAGLNQHYMFAKYGLPTLAPTPPQKTAAPVRPTVPDKGGL